MLNVRHPDWKLATRYVVIALSLAVVVPSIANAQQASTASSTPVQNESRQALLDRLALLEKRLAELTGGSPQASPVTLTAMAEPQAAPQQRVPAKR